MTYKSPLLITLALLVVCASSSAFAGKPAQHCHGYFGQIAVVDCGDFSVMDDAEVFMHIKDWRDKNGNLKRSHVKLTATDMFYRDDDPDGLHLTGTANINDRATYDELGLPNWTTTPIYVDMHVSGVGLKFIYAGTLEMDENGYCAGLCEDSWDRFADWSQADFDALCAYFE